MTSGHYRFRDAEAHELFREEVYNTPYWDAYEERAKRRDNKKIRWPDEDTLEGVFTYTVDKKFKGKTLDNLYKGLCLSSPEGHTPFIECKPEFKSAQGFADKYWVRIPKKSLSKKVASQVRRLSSNSRIQDSVLEQQGVVWASADRKHSKKVGAHPPKYWDDANERVWIFGTLMKSLATVPVQADNQKELRAPDRTIQSLMRLSQRLGKEKGELRILLMNPDEKAYDVYLDSIIGRRGDSLFDLFSKHEEYKRRAEELQRLLIPGEIRYHDVYPQQSFTIVDDTVMFYVKFPGFERDWYPIFECKKVSDQCIFTQFEHFFEMCWEPKEGRIKTVPSLNGTDVLKG